jgi:hypothetical protein
MRILSAALHAICAGVFILLGRTQSLSANLLGTMPKPRAAHGVEARAAMTLARGAGLGAPEFWAQVGRTLEVGWGCMARVPVPCFGFVSSLTNSGADGPPRAGGP